MIKLRSIGIAVIAATFGVVPANPVHAAEAPAPSASPPASASVNPYHPAYQHPYRHGAVPTFEAKAQMDAYSAAHTAPAAAAASPNQLAYGGGATGTAAVTGAPKVYLVFWGSQWGTVGTDGSGNTTLSGDPLGEAPVLQKMLKGLGTGGETWSGVATQYCEGVSRNVQSCPANFPHVAYPSGGALAGVWVDESSAAPANATAAQISAEAVAAAAHFNNTTEAANVNAQYVVLSPTGTHPDNFNAGGNFCAWHSNTTTSYGDIAFHNEPYVPDMGTSCGQNYVRSGAAGLVDGVTLVEGHEYIETLTDRNPGSGWMDASGSEISDKCTWKGTTPPQGAAVLSLPTGDFAMQANWSNDANGGAGDCLFTHPIVTGGPNLALRQPVTASGSVSGYPAANATDGNTGSYWESTNNQFPQTLTVDVGMTTEVGKVTVSVPPSWGARTQTLSVLTSADGTTYNTSVASTSYTFNPSTGNTVTIPVPTAYARLVRLNVTANTGWPAAQVAEFGVYPPAPAGGSAYLQLSPLTLVFNSQNVGTTSAAQLVTIKNVGTSAAGIASISTDVPDFVQTNNCGNSLAAGASCTASVTFKPTMSGRRRGGLRVDATSGPYGAALEGTGVAVNVALHKTTTVSSTTQPYVAANLTDGDTGTYWQSTSAFPQWASVDLGSPSAISKVVLTLPLSWGARTQTLSVLTSPDGITYNTAVASASYTFDPSTANSVTIVISATNVRAVRLNFTANTGWTGAQLSEFQVYGP